MASNIQRFLEFQREQGGVLPPSLAADYLGMARQNLHAAKKKKNIRSMVVAGTAYYGVASLREFKELRTAKAAIEASLRKPVTD